MAVTNLLALGICGLFVFLIVAMLRVEQICKLSNLMPATVSEQCRERA